MRQFEILQPRAVVFKCGSSNFVFIPGVNDLPDDFEDELSKRKGWQKQIDRLAAAGIARVLKEGESGAQVDASGSPFGVKFDVAKKIIEAQLSLPTLKSWLRNSKAKGGLKKAIEERIALRQLELEDQKS